MMRPLLERLTRLPRHPFKLARALVRSAPPCAPRFTRSPRPVEPRRPGEPPRVLVAHHDPDLGACIQLILELEGYRVITATTEADILTCCASEVFDLVIARDPLNYASIIETVRTFRGNTRVPAIALTTRNSREDIRYLLQQGYQEVIIQPFDPEELLLAVHSALRVSSRPGR